jgi:hypothetical protein
MAKFISNQLKNKIKNTKQDIDRKILALANESLSGIKNQVQKHTSLDMDKLELNSDLARNVAIRVLEKAQEVRKSLTTDELIKLSKDAPQKILNRAKKSFIKPKPS